MARHRPRLAPSESSLGEIDPSAAAMASTLGEYVAERTVAKADYLPTWFLRVGVERARAVTHIEFEFQGRPLVGTGFMVSPSLMLTNHHVFPSAEAARGARIFFDYEDDEAGRQLNPTVFLAQPDNFYVANKRLDFALVAVDQTPGARWGTIPLLHCPKGLRVGERVNIVQHPLGRRKQVVLHGNEIVEVSDAAIKYLADTEGGSSGSPVFNESWDLIALHHLGGSKDNVGVRMDRILKYLAVTSTEGAGGPLLRELLDSVADSGDLGWFATTGLRPPTTAERDAGEGPEELVALDWQGGAEFLDPGHWDLSPLFAGFASEGSGVDPEAARAKLEAIAATVDEAGADFMVLEGIPPGLRPSLMDVLQSLGQGALPLSDNALLSLDPAVKAEARRLDESQGKIAAATCRGEPVLPCELDQLELSVERPGAASSRKLVLHFLELDPERQLSSRFHRAELARVLAELALACELDVVVVGALATVLDRPMLVRGAKAPPELTIVAAASPATGTIAWIGDGRGADLEHIYCAEEVRSIVLDPKVLRHDHTRPLPLPPELVAAGPPLLLRARFGELARPAAKPRPEPPTPSEAAKPESSAREGGREIPVDGHVKSILILD